MITPNAKEGGAILVTAASIGALDTRFLAQIRSKGNKSEKGDPANPQDWCEDGQTFYLRGR